MRDTLPLLNQRGFPQLRRKNLEILQVNLGYKCNLSCLHCHVNAGPTRKEVMTRSTVETVIDFIASSNVHTLDLTGGAPEMHPQFRDLVEEAGKYVDKVIDRCNLTILLEPGYEDIYHFLAKNRIEVVASLPCYLKDNVEKQRGKGVYDASIEGIRRLNEVGYGKAGSTLELNLVYNPQGPVLPPPQEGLEDDYKNYLKDKFDIYFNRLLTITNMPIGRFGSVLLSRDQFDPYMDLLTSAYSRDNLETVMCKNLLSVDWQGYVYDCDFNQMLNLPLKLTDRRENGKSKNKGNGQDNGATNETNGDRQSSLVHLADLLKVNLSGNSITVRDHCFGCTAGQGSSCSGALS